MAGALAVRGGSSDDDLIASHSPSVTLKYRWEVAFSRFFNFPRIRSSSVDLRPLPLCKTRCKGTWVSSSSSPSLCLVPEPEPMLFVSMQGKILEEHFVSNLHFSWPQVSCATDCPTRGSRVMFASYRDIHGEIQKFALRFSSGNDAQTFMDAVKKSLMDTISIKFPGGDFVCENSSQSEYIASNALQNRTDEESNFANPDVDCSPEMPLLNFLDEQHVHTQQPSITNNVEPEHLVLPPSFTDLLTGNSIDIEKDPPKATEETDLRSQITRYLLDSSFHDMLVKVDKVIGELGGDLTL